MVQDCELFFEIFVDIVIGRIHAQLLFNFREDGIDWYSRTRFEDLEDDNRTKFLNYAAAFNSFIHIGVESPCHFKPYIYIKLCFYFFYQSLRRRARAWPKKDAPHVL